MSNSEHTPGPWCLGAFRHGGSFPGVDVGAADGSNIAIVHHEEIDRPAVETRANACLVAAAPELLGAAEKALSYMRLHRYADEAWADDLAAAINKAKGKG